MTVTYKGSDNSALVAAVRACTLPDGATHTWLTEYTGLPPLRVSKALTYLSNQAHLIFPVKFGKWIKYFASPEAREAAAPALAEFKEALRLRKKAMAAAAYQRQSAASKEKRLARQRARYAKKKAARPPRPPREKVVVAKRPRPAKPAKPVKAIAEGLPAVSIARPKVVGPARMEGEPVITPHTKFTIAPPPPERIWRTNTFAA